MLSNAEKQNFKNLGEKVRKYRNSNDMTQAQLAFEIGTTLRQIQRIEAGNANCGLIYFIRISEVLSIPIDKLLA